MCSGWGDTEPAFGMRSCGGEGGISEVAKRLMPLVHVGWDCGNLNP